jgi:small GTP-binding protein
MTYKIILLGDSMVGKSSFVIRYIYQSIPPNQTPTIGAAMFSKNINTPNFKGHLNIWDTAGQERYKSLAPLYYRGAHIALIIYDITSETSFENAKINVEKLQNSENPIIALIGNKTDLTARTIDYDEAYNWAKENNIYFFESSTKLPTDNSVNIIFDTLLKLLPSESPDSLTNTIQNKSKCC